MPVRSGSLHDEVAGHKGMAIALEVVGAERGRGQVAPVLLGDRPGERTAHPIARVKIRSPGSPVIRGREIETSLIPFAGLSRAYRKSDNSGDLLR